MVFDFIESGIALFDDTFNTIKGLFDIVPENLTPSTLVNCGMGLSSTGPYIRWFDSATTYYTLTIQPNASLASNKAYISYYDGTNTTRLITFTVS